MTTHAIETRRRSSRSLRFFNRRGLLAVAALLAGGGARAEVRVGDDYARVIAEKGKPSASMDARGMQLLQYPGERLRLKEGRVVAIEPVARPAVAPAAPKPPVAETKPAAKPAAADAEADPALMPAHFCVVEAVQEGNTVTFWATTTHCADITVQFNVEGENIVSSQPLPCIVESKGRSRFEIVTLRPKDPKKNSSWENSLFTSTLGSRNGKPDGTAFVLPYGEEVKCVMSQGPFGKASHQEENAYDFDMPEGTTLCAARGGVVVGARQDSNVGGILRKYQDSANFLVIRHSDGTYAQYLHLKQNGLLVKMGDTVRTGQPIALSGATGWVSGPHLHFEVFAAGDGAKRVTFPVKFRLRDKSVAELQTEVGY